jgi:hypothetical protein
MTLHHMQLWYDIKAYSIRIAMTLRHIPFEYDIVYLHVIFMLRISDVV